MDLKRLRRDLESGSSPSYEALQEGLGARARRRRTRGWVLAVTVGAAILALVMTYLQFRPTNDVQRLGISGKSLAGKVSLDRTMIAVLPFENLGPPEDEYFAAGITDEITSRLAMVRGLGVISRKSAPQYAGTDKTSQQVGEELGVEYILEGTIRWARMSGNASRVRITPQLIRVADNTHLWAETYDRVLEDIFEIQSEAAKQVVEKLGVAILLPERQALEAKPTEVLEAYQVHLRGKELMEGLLSRYSCSDPQFCRHQ